MFTGALAVLSLFCHDVFTHLPLHQTVNPPPTLPRAGASPGLFHLASRHTVGAHETCVERMRMEEEEELSSSKLIRSGHSFPHGVIQPISKQTPGEGSELGAGHGLGDRHGT